jgi:NAD(P)-dependent dehydrogenase (short-subunit alcohol dehydrogenase family)
MKTLKELMDLSGRVALITGGSGYVGSTAGQSLAELGAKVAVLDIEQEKCDAVATVLSETYKVDCVGLAVDLSATDEIARVPARVKERLGRLDIIIHSAAYTANVPGWAVPFEEQSVEPWDRAMRINMTAAFLLVQAAKDLLVQSERGSVLFVSSIYGIVGPDMRLYKDTGMNNAAGYAATKGGLLQLMRYLATVLAPHVRVNAISPGGIWRNQPEQFHERYKARTPLGRMATEEDLKGAIAYLASDLSNYVTGHNLIIDGGWTAW